MASSATTSLVSMTLCVLLLAMAATSVSSVPAPPPVHGQWTGWGDWSECDQLDPCHSFQTSTRSCADPPPLNGGRPCRGSSSRTRPCRRQPDCAGSWQHWGAWTACSTTECGQTGITTRTRVCDGADCPGLFLEWDGCEGAC